MKLNRTFIARVTKGLLAAAVFVCFLFSSSLPVHAADITHKANISRLTMGIVNGSTVTPIVNNGVAEPGAPDIKLGDTVKMQYSWSIPASQMSGISGGDYFTIELPKSEYISSIAGTFDIKDGSGTILGTYTIGGGVITATINNTGAAQAALTGGYFTIYGSAIKAGDNVSILSDGSVTINIKPGGGGGGGGGNDAGNAAILDSKVVFTKDGKQYPGRNELNWHMNVNYDGLREMITGNPVTQKDNVVLVDNLPADVTVRKSSIYISTPLFVPTPTNEMSGYSITHLRVPYVPLTPTDGESYGAFHDRVKNYGSVCVGVYEENGKNAIIFGFGDLPGNGLTYVGLMGGQNKFDELVDGAIDTPPHNITAAQGNRMKLVYGSLSGTTGGQIVGFDVSFDTTVDGESGNYSNSADLNWDTGTATDTVLTLAFNKVDAGITGDEKVSVRVTKAWVGGSESEVTVILNANGTEYKRKTITAADGWSYIFSKLPKYDTSNNLIDYTVTELPISGYTMSVTGSASTGYTVTNTKGGGTPGTTPAVTPGTTPAVTPGVTPGITPGVSPGSGLSPQGEDTASGPNTSYKNPATGDNTSMTLWISLMIFSAILIGVLMVVAHNGRKK